ncbi:beta-phosphoglucomutase [Paenibacillus oralis]|uniref:Beta-phosphoglucomutase n=1 Tax=Paenibacillus oralis TaxID=2490856 RepID=A0A3P3U8Y7_9BACL|nr:beta-phosphoglucomutase [Paenibacillus oralis]RRJ64923.1 beta-phosphoglucomutase [Paenibacillus oralis]
MQPKAFIFDLDGVITDTAEYHYLAWKQIGEELGIEVDRELNERLKGVSRMESLERILAAAPRPLSLTAGEKEQWAAQKNAVYGHLIETIRPSDVLPGIEGLLKDIRNANMLLALGSASRNAKVVLERLGLTAAFDYIVDAGQIRFGKPHPETFVNAAEHFGIPCEACVGVEDSEAGIEAINGAGMFSVGIGSPESLRQAKYLVSDTSRLTLDGIMEAYRRDAV